MITTDELKRVIKRDKFSSTAKYIVSKQTKSDTGRTSILLFLSVCEKKEQYYLLVLTIWLQAKFSVSVSSRIQGFWRFFLVAFGL